MLAAVYHGSKDLRVEEREIPAVGPDEMLLRVEAASICATDLRIYQGSHRKYSPGTVRVPGHEVVGTLAEVGGNVRGYHVGQRVFIAPNIGCGKCRQCRAGRNNLCPDYDAFGITIDGGFAEYMRITQPAIEQGNVIVADSAVDPAGMALAEPFSCVLHGQEAVSVGKGDIVLIKGAGPIGIMHLLLARRRGARHVLMSEQSPQRIAAAYALGADHVIDIAREDLLDAVLRESSGVGADVVIVATAAAAALENAVRAAAVGGRINFFAGLPKEQPLIALDANLVHYRELVVTGTTGCSTADCCRAANLVASGEMDLTPLISGRFPLRDAISGFKAAQDRNGLKVVLEPLGRSPSREGRDSDER
jgi:L-iditol 2-dehydrogenase